MNIPRCSKCKYSNEWEKQFIGWGSSAGSRYIAIVYECKHPEIKHTISLTELQFKGKTSPRNCPLRLKNIKNAK